MFNIYIHIICWGGGGFTIFFWGGGVTKIWQIFWSSRNSRSISYLTIFLSCYYTLSNCQIPRAKLVGEESKFNFLLNTSLTAFHVMHWRLQPPKKFMVKPMKMHPIQDGNHEAQNIDRNSKAILLTDGCY